MVNRDFCRIIRNTRLSLSRERLLLLYGYYNSEQPPIQVKICTAVDKEKRNCGNARDETESLQQKVDKC